MKPREITSIATLGRTVNTEYQIVYCGTPWSVPCRTQYSILMKIAEYYTGWRPIAQVDIEKYPEIASELAIQSIPTILVFSRGREIHRIVGLQSLKNLLNALTDFLPAQAMTPFNEEIKSTHSRRKIQVMRG